MKRFIAITFALCALSIAAFAQWMPQRDNEEARKQGAERINSAKVAFFTQQLDLSVDEAQKFWPVYNDYNKQVDAVREASRKATMTMNDPSKKADELKAALKTFSDSQKKEAQLTEQYINNLMKILPVEKVAKVFSAEDMFRMQLLYQFRMGGPNGGPGNGQNNNQGNNKPGDGGWAPWQRNNNNNKDNK